MTRKSLTVSILSLALSVATLIPASAQYGLFAPTPSTSPETTSLWYQTQGLLGQIHREFGVAPQRPYGRNTVDTLAMIQELNRQLAPFRTDHTLTTPHLDAQRDAELRRKNLVSLLLAHEQQCRRAAQASVALGMNEHAAAYLRLAAYYRQKANEISRLR